ncbi:hypothetical protein TNCT_556141 [Trichonephila clavata]|uniref:Uncharacterized protein n=1 Tax=Trichonephila clavata TaxID=2740835 RepID=A0A8X6J662_TRICU|nr:hypothetical protein TNCT_556141 [Trichonephila clavata]
MLTQDEASELFFKLGRKNTRAQHGLVTAIVEGKVKLSTNHELNFYFANPTFSWQNPPDIRGGRENGSIIFPEFVERFKQETTEEDAPRFRNTIIYDADGNPTESCTTKTTNRKIR